jgi:hypothetical protein
MQCEAISFAPFMMQFCGDFKKILASRVPAVEASEQTEKRPIQQKIRAKPVQTSARIVRLRYFQMWIRSLDVGPEARP